MNGKCSQWAPVLSGTPEGGLLSPLLFACFINDLPDCVQSDCLMFADDVKLYGKVDSAADADFLQQQLENMLQWSARWRLTLNPSKCKVLTLTLRRVPTVSVYNIGGRQIESARDAWPVCIIG